MIKVLRSIVIFLFLFLVSCSPKTIIVEVTSTPQPTEASIATAIPTPLLTPTNSPMPSMITLAITNEDINEILPGNFYTSDLTILQNEEDKLTGAQVFEGGFTSSVEVGTIWLTLPGSSCEGRTLDMARQGGVKEGTPIEKMKIYLADDFWMQHTKENNHINFGYSVGEMCVMFEYEVPPSLNAEDASGFLSLMAQKQMIKLQEAGY